MGQESKSILSKLSTIRQEAKSVLKSFQQALSRRRSCLSGIKQSGVSSALLHVSPSAILSYQIISFLSLAATAFSKDLLQLLESGYLAALSIFSYPQFVKGQKYTHPPPV